MQYIISDTINRVITVKTTGNTMTDVETRATAEALLEAEGTALDWHFQDITWRNYDLAAVRFVAL